MNDSCAEYTSTNEKFFSWTVIPLFLHSSITVYHAVPSLQGAIKAANAGVDGLVIEGTEGGGLTMVDLLQKAYQLILTFLIFLFYSYLFHQRKFL